MPKGAYFVKFGIYEERFSHCIERQVRHCSTMKWCFGSSRYAIKFNSVQIQEISSAYADETIFISRYHHLSAVMDRPFCPKVI